VPDATVLSAAGVASAAVIAAAASILTGYYQRQSASRSEHRHRAFEQHLEHYEKIFVAARSLQDAFNDYRAVNFRVSDRSDPFLRQLLTIVRSAAYQYCVAVEWRHNPGMAYLDLKLEQECLSIRALLHVWLSRQRTFPGNVAFVRVRGADVPISRERIAWLRAGDYQELRIEKRILVSNHPDDRRLSTEIDEKLSTVIKELKAVMAY
jgi:hypothetical protein